MHPQFAESYRSATLERDDEFLQSRWKVVAELTSQLTPAGTLELVRIHLDLPTYDRAAVSSLFDAVKDQGPQYARPEVTLELRLLAGIALAHLLTDSKLRDKRTADLAALAIACGRTWQSTIAAPMMLTDLQQNASAHLMERAVAARSISDRPVKINISTPNWLPPALQFPSKKFDLSTPIKVTDRYGQALQEQTASFSLKLVQPDAEALNEWTAKLGSYFTELATTLSRETSRAFQQQLSRIPHIRAVLQEENNILWWLFGESSNRLRRPFSSIPLPALCAISAQELDELTRIVPGPAAAPAFLARALRSGRDSLPDKISRLEITAAPLTDWSAAPPPVSDLCPVTTSLHHRTASTSISGGRFADEMSPIELACQIYFELQLQRLHQEIVS